MMQKSNDVDFTPVIFSTSEETPTHRLGTYYLETGYGIRPSKVIYDRKHSAFDEYDFTKVDLKNYWMAIPGCISMGLPLLLGERCRKTIIDCLKIAKRMESPSALMEISEVHYGAGKRQENSVASVSSVCRYFDGNRTISLMERRKNNYSAGDVKDDIPFQPDFRTARDSLQCIC